MGKKRGLWGGSDNVHGNAPKLLKALLLADAIEKGLEVPHSRYKASKSAPQWFTEDRKLTFLGRAYLWKIRQRMPFLFR